MRGLNKTGGLGAVIAACMMLLAVPAAAQSGSGGGMMGGPMMGPGMMGPGMMGPNGCPGCGMMWNNQPRNLNLSVADVRANLERSLEWRHSTRLKVGPVVETDANTITADIVTADRNVLVERYAVDRHTGYYRPAE